MSAHRTYLPLEDQAKSCCTFHVPSFGPWLFIVYLTYLPQLTFTLNDPPAVCPVISAALHSRPLIPRFLGLGLRHTPKKLGLVFSASSSHSSHKSLYSHFDITCNSSRSFGPHQQGKNPSFQLAVLVCDWQTRGSRFPSALVPQSNTASRSIFNNPRRTSFPTNSSNLSSHHHNSQKSNLPTLIIHSSPPAQQLPALDSLVLVDQHIIPT